MMETQLKRGSLDVCVLTALLKEDSYGYQIIKDLKDVIEISESTLYPILKRLENPVAFEPYNSLKDRKHKYYRIIVKNYSVFYVVIDNVMEVRRFIYNGRDISKFI